MEILIRHEMREAKSFSLLSQFHPKGHYKISWVNVNGKEKIMEKIFFTIDE
jgi:hypothetical protein